MKNTKTSLQPSVLSYNKVFLKEQGNIRPIQLYDIIKFPNGKADHLAIDLYSDFRSWYKHKRVIQENGDIIYISKLKSRFYKTSYCYLSKKYRVSKETIRSKLVKLEELGLLNRAFTCEKRYYEREENNVLNILVWKQTPYFESSIGLERSKDLLAICYKKNGGEELHPSPSETGDIYSNTNNLSLSNLKKEILHKACESNFIESNLREEAKVSYSQNNFVENTVTDLQHDFDTKPPVTLEQTLVTLNTTPKPVNLLTKIKAKFTGNKRKAILEFYPLTEEDAVALSLSSAREFNLNYINKLILKLSKDKPSHGFYTKKLFLKYMSEVLRHELREESIVNRETFNFKADDEAGKIEEYLKQIEESSLIDKVNQLKKKIAAVYEPKLAYRILTSIRLKEDITDNIFKITLLKAFTLSDYESKLLLGEIRAIFGNEISAVEFIDRKNSSLPAGQALQTSELDKLELNLGIEGSLWNKVSKKLLEYYGEGIHRSWFSKLESIETFKDGDNKSVTVADNSVNTSTSTGSLVLRAPSSFIRDWIQSNYLRVMYESLQCLGGELKDIEIAV